MQNGPGLRVILWVSGCSHHCKGCHNPETWNSNLGKNFDFNSFADINQKISKDYISGITYSGGDPLYDTNVNMIHYISSFIRKTYPTKTQWLYTGYRYEDILKSKMRKEILKYVDVLVDSKFDINLKDTSLLYRGSSNQRIIKVQESLKKDKIILW